MGKKKKRNKSKTPMKKTSWKIIPKLNCKCKSHVLNYMDGLSFLDKGRKMNLSRGLQDLRHKLK